MYDEIDYVVHVYAPEESEVENHMKLVESYNTRSENPTSWKTEMYKGPDYLEKMFSDKAGNVVIISGNNKSKSKYITMAITIQQRKRWKWQGKNRLILGDNQII